MKKGIDFTGIAVCPFIHDGKGNYLLSLRTDKCRDEHHCWEPAGGGGLQFGESTADAMLREAKEELGVTLSNFDFIGHRESFREHEGKKTHWILFDYTAQADPEQIKIMEPEMCAELRWCKFSEIPKPAYSPYSLVFEKYKDKL